MLANRSLRMLVLCAGAALLSFTSICPAQESRGSITGRITDPQNALVAGANITVTNVETNTSRKTVTNETGYYEVVLLDPGTYSVTAESQGFKKLVRAGVVLSTGDRLTVDMQLAIGQTSQSVEVTADAPLLDTASASGGRVLDPRNIAQLPYNTMNPFILQAIAPGMIFTGTLGNNRVMDHAGTSSYETSGLGNGAGEFLLDGNPVTGTNGGRAGFVPSSEAVAEVRIETNPFDATMGHAIGARINATIKSGNNSLHGSAFEQMQQNRWNATNHFTREAYYNNLAAGKIAPGTPKQNSGYFSQPGFSAGAPVYIPKIINGKNKLFFYLEFDKITSKVAPNNNSLYYTVPTEAERRGDFAALQAVDPVKYTIYDPRTAVQVSGGHVQRTPFPNNALPQSLMNNPIYKFMSQVYPLPNNPAALADGTNNYYDSTQASNDYFTSLINRYDWNITDRQRLNGKWYYNHRFSDQYDWAHTTPLKGYYSNGLWRPTKGGSLDWTDTLNPSNILDVMFSVTQYSEGSKQPVKFQYTASDAGLPSYIDQKAGADNVIPSINIAGMANAASTSFIGEPGLNQTGTTLQLNAKMTTIRGRHTMNYGVEERRYHYATVNPLGNTTGYYQFSNTYLRATDTTTTASTLGLGWAAFLMGLPNSMTLDTNDTGYYSTPYHSLFFQDDFRITDRFRIGFGLRFEREGGTTERFNRGLAGAYDYNFVPPYAKAVQDSYTSWLSANANTAAGQTLQQGMPASAFVVAGGVTYLGQPYANFTSGTNRFLPNVSAVYQVTNKTVVRFGTGWYADTFNAMGGTGNRPALTGYSQQTSTQITTDNGYTFCCGVGAASNLGSRNPMMDPFPVNAATGSRWVTPLGNSLGSNIRDGQGATDLPRDYSPSWQQRWKLAIQRELHPNHMVEVSYDGAYSSSPASRSQTALPWQYWNYSTTFGPSVKAVDDAMKATVNNPFLAALPAIQSSNPAVYNYLSSVGIFSSKTLAVQQLLRGYPNSGFSLSKSNSLRTHGMYHDLQVSYTKRWSNGFDSSVMYTRTWGRNQYFPNEFNTTPSWQLNPNTRPNRFVWTTVWELPFGKGRRWITSGPMQHIVGGWQLSWIYQYQTGALISWGNPFYYGTPDQIAKALNHDNYHAQNLDAWFDPAVLYKGGDASNFVGFEGRSANQPGTYQARIFPQYIGSLRADSIRNWDTRIYRRFTIYERLNLNLSADLLNMTNHTQFAGPDIGVTSLNFGKVTSTANQPRFIQLNMRIDF